MAESELAAELFGAARGPWERLLGTVLGNDGRLRRALRRLGMPALDNPLVELGAAQDEKPELPKLARARGIVVPSRLGPGALAELALKVAAAGGEGKSALGATGWRRLLDARLL